MRTATWFERTLAGTRDCLPELEAESIPFLKNAYSIHGKPSIYSIENTPEVMDRGPRTIRSGPWRTGSAAFTPRRVNASWPGLSHARSARRLPCHMCLPWQLIPSRGYYVVLIRLIVFAGPGSSLREEIQNEANIAGVPIRQREAFRLTLTVSTHPSRKAVPPSRHRRLPMLRRRLIWRTSLRGSEHARMSATLAAIF